ncbi:phosphoribosylanthranilate isomerase [Gelidibacter sp. F2691]|nr:phosphoribosylanthranilate isomerase [Gelidibacter sp. F2691]
MKLKICGMKYQENIAEVATLQPDYLGFIFYEKSSRYFNGTIPELPESIKKVGVFVNSSEKDILEKVAQHNLDLIQLHGEESPEYCKKLRSSLINRSREKKHIQIIKVFSIKDQFNFDELTPYESVCDYFLFDTKGQLPGGNGYTFNWDVLQDYPSTKPYFLSGGIGLEEIENINKFMQGEASQFCHAIDVNSKFESEPGLKDYQKLKEFKNQITSNDLTAQ